MDEKQFLILSITNLLTPILEFSSKEKQNHCPYKTNTESHSMAFSLCYEWTPCVPSQIRCSYLKHRGPLGLGQRLFRMHDLGSYSPRWGSLLGADGGLCLHGSAPSRHPPRSPWRTTLSFTLAPASGYVSFCSRVYADKPVGWRAATHRKAFPCCGPGPSDLPGLRAGGRPGRRPPATVSGSRGLLLLKDRY